MPPKLSDGGFVPYEFFDQDGRPVTIETVELPPEPGYEPLYIKPGNFTATAFMTRANWKRMKKGLKSATNHMNRFVRTIKRRREKERRRRLKGGQK